MAVRFKICVDSTDPHLLANFWAEAMGYVVEDHSAFIEILHRQGAIGEDDFIEVDGRKAFKTAAAIRDPDDPMDPQSGVGRGARILFQVVPEKKTVKNRLHLDLHYGADCFEAAAARLEDLGATRLSAHDEQGSKWVVMADPEGNEFCAHA
ncbi:VOC family protein [Glycomyces sp. L485]|uniref:VOC family protein n=1 Tax=Glycomyces sp. L485 TaxID=2909235 RepID=UPI001F4AE2CD|nr:VOC family protein [Glycomyces sp. L485]MCH7232701.1 VOC family protein [Glycomyces sp. L485]